MVPVMNEDWTVDVVARMHKYRITNQQLADRCEYTATYLSMLLNGRRQLESDAAKEATQQRILTALEELEAEALEEM